MSKGLTILAALLIVLPLTGCSREARKARFLHRAEQSFNRGEYDKAKIEYSNVLRLDLQNALAYQRIGLMWFEEGAPLRAAPFLLKTRELDPANSQNRLKLAQVYLGIGRRADAIKEAVALLEQDPRNGDAIRVYADAARSAEELESLEQALQKFPNPDDVSFQLALAMNAMRKNDPATAERAMKQALATAPQSRSAHSFAATYALLQKDVKKAREEFKTASDLSPPRSIERLRYVQFIAQSGAVDDAMNSLRSIIKQAPDFLPAWTLLAEYTLARKNYDEALRLLENVLNRDGENLDASILRGKVLLAKGEKEKAVEAFERLDKRYPTFAPIRYQLARAYLEKNNTSQAIAVLNQITAASPDFVDAALLLAQVNLRNGNPQAVVEALEALLKAHPDATPAQVLLADAYRNLGRFDDAAAIFRGQINNGPQKTASYIALGIILRQQKKNDEAREAFEKAVQLAPNDQLGAIQLIDLEISLNHFDRALQLAQDQIKSKPESAMAHFLEGKVYVAQRKWDSAEAALSKSISLDSNFIAAYELLASTYLAANRLPEAARQLETVLSKSPTNARALMSLGIVYEKIGEFPKAGDVYEKILTLSPDFSPALNNLAWLDLEHLNQPERALQLAQKAHGLQPTDASIADTLGWILYKKGDYQPAIVLLQESATKAPNEPQIQYHLGMAHYMMGQKDAARAAFEQAIHVAPDFPEKQEIQRRLTLLSETSSPSQLSVEELKSMLNRQPHDMVALVRLAEAYQRNQAFKDAAATYESILKLNPKLLSATISLAKLYSGPLHDRNKALELAKTAREIAPNDRDTAILLGRVAYQAGNFAWAYGLLEQSARDLPNDVDLLHDLAWTAYSLGKITQARQWMEQIIAIAPDSGPANDAKSFLRMIALEQNLSEAVAAQDEVTKILQADPGYVPARLVQAAIKLNLGDSNAAAATYEDVLRRFPDFGPAQKNLAEVYAQKPENLFKAYELALKARKNLPDDPDAANVLAEITYQRKEYARAVQLLQESARKQPLSAKYLYYLGMSCARTNQIAEARTALDQALATGLKDPLADDARRTLATLNHD